MKALSRKTQLQKRKDEVDKYITDNYEEVIYDAIAMNAPYVTKQAVAEFLLALSMHGYGTKRLKEMYDWYIAVCNMPGKIMGQAVNADSVINEVQSKYDIDFSQINLSYQSYEDFCRERDAKKERNVHD